MPSIDRWCLVTASTIRLTGWPFTSFRIISRIFCAVCFKFSLTSFNIWSDKLSGMPAILSSSNWFWIIFWKPESCKQSKGLPFTETISVEFWSSFNRFTATGSFRFEIFSKICSWRFKRWVTRLYAFWPLYKKPHNVHLCVLFIFSANYRLISSKYGIAFSVNVSSCRFLFLGVFTGLYIRFGYE